MDTIIIRDLELFLRVGVPETERARPQRLLVSIELARDFTRAVGTDDVRSSIDYARVCERLAEWGAGRSWRLIEIGRASCRERE